MVRGLAQMDLSGIGSPRSKVGKMMHALDACAKSSAKVSLDTRAVVVRRAGVVVQSVTVADMVSKLKPVEPKFANVSNVITPRRFTLIGGK